MKFQKGDIVVNKKSGEVYKVVQVFTATFDVMGKLGYCYGLPMKDFDLFDFTIGSLCSVRGKNCMFKEIHYMAQKAILIEEDSGEETQAPLEELRPPKSKEMEYKAGDKLRVLKNRHHHGFKIGETVRVIDCDGGDTTPYHCTDLKENEYWWLSDEEVELDTRRRFERGDVVEITKDISLHGLDIGTKATVYDCDESTVYITQNDGGMILCVTFDEVREVATKHPSTSDFRFKEGDKLRVIKNEYGHAFEIGSVVCVSDIDLAPKSILIYLCTNEEGTRYWMAEEDVEPVENITNLKVGDKVRIIRSGKAGSWHRFGLGEYVEVCDINSDKIYCRSLNEGERWFVYADEIECLEPMTEPTLKYKVGDKIQVIRNHYKHEFPIGDVVEVVFIDSDTEDTPYKCKGPDGDVWWLGEDEVQPFERVTEKFSRRPVIIDPYKDNYIAGVPDHIDGGFDMKVEWKPIKPSPPRLSIKPKKNHRPGLEVKKFNTEKIKLKS